MNYLAISAIFKMENPWLAEWIEYHRLSGIEHFYLFNNDDDTSESDAILQPYVDSGLVDNIHFPGKVMQFNSMQETIKNFHHMNRWIAFIDLDEFIFPRKTRDIREVLQHYETESGLAVHWCLFGSNGLIKRPPGQIHHFQRRGEFSHTENRHIKSIVDPKTVLSCRLGTPHYFECDSGRVVNEKFRLVNSPFDDYCGDDIRLNHYRVRSLQDFEEVKLSRGRPDCSFEVNPNYFELYDLNDVYDDEISHRYNLL